MAVLDILQIGDPVLRKKSTKITRFDDGLVRLAEDMIETMHAANGVGLAAPQVGVTKRLIVVEMPDDPDYPHPGERWVMCNPQIVKTSRTTEIGQEGCLSVAGYVGRVERSEWAIVRGQDLRGRKMQVKAQDYLARAFLHEIDHLNGYVDIAEKGSVLTLEEYERRLELERQQMADQPADAQTGDNLPVRDV